jgi:hypothetical protein
MKSSRGKSINQLMPEVALHRITIDERWEIRDLYFFPHRYAEVYSFLYALHEASLNHGARFAEVFHRYPWRGGYSAVNFYDDLYDSIPRAHRPRINSIHYASPGYIELGAVLVIVTQIDKILTGAMKIWDKLDKIYTAIHKRAMQRRLLKFNVKEHERKLAEEEVRFLINSTKELAEAIGIDDPAALNRLTGDPLASLKILMAFYRRFRELVSFVQEGKVRIEPPDKKRLQDKPLD